MSCPSSSRALFVSRRRPSRALIAALISVSLLAGCGSTSSSSSAGSTSASAASSDGGSAVTVAGVSVRQVPQLANMVPAASRSEGLSLLWYNFYPPDFFVQNGTLIGSQVELARAVAAVLGLRAKDTISNAFDTFVPSIQDGRFNTSFLDLLVTPARIKVVDIVSTESTGTGFAAKPGAGTPTLSTPLDLCGRSFAGIVASAYVASVQTVGDKCKAAGKPSPTIATYPTDAAAELAVRSGRQQYYVSGGNEIVWRFHNAGGELTAEPLNFAPVATGAVVSKPSGLAQPIAAAINHLIATGVYQAIMKKWHEEPFEIAKAVVYG